MSMSVRVSVCLSSRISQKPNHTSGLLSVYKRPVTASQPFSGGVVISCVLLVLWMTLCFPITEPVVAYVTPPQQPRCSVVYGLTPLMRDIGCVRSYTTAGAKTRRVLRARVTARQSISRRTNGRSGRSCSNGGGLWKHAVGRSCAHYVGVWHEPNVWYTIGGPRPDNQRQDHDTLGETCHISRSRLCYKHDVCLSGCASATKSGNRHKTGSVGVLLATYMPKLTRNVISCDPGIWKKCGFAVGRHSTARMSRYFSVCRASCFRAIGPSGNTPSHAACAVAKPPEAWNSGRFVMIVCINIWRWTGCFRCWS